MTENATQRIAALNDQFRREGPGAVPGRRFATAGVSALPFPLQMAIWRAVATFDAFTEDNDPYGERDFGAVDLPGAAGRIFWKIDHYADSAMEWGSEDPADPAKCFRVLTVMLANEY